MLDRENLIKKKQALCEERIEKLHQDFPRLREIAEELGRLCLERIRVGILDKNPYKATEIDREVSSLIKEKELILKANSLPLDIYEPQWDCVKCQDKGYLEPGVLCQCFKQERLEHLFGQSRITGNMRDKTFNNFSTCYYHDEKSMLDKVHRCLNFVEKLAKGERQNNLFFSGDVGRGKTHLSLAIANEVMLLGRTVIYYRIDDLLDAIRQYKYEKEQELSGNNCQLQLLRSVDLLIIDDLGAETLTPFAENQIRMIIEDRNNLNKPWIINSNLSIEELQKIYGQRITDRIIEKSYIFSFEAPHSIRETLRRQAKNQKNGH